MTQQDLLIRQLEQGQESFLAMVKKVPSDRLDWTPNDTLRSALDQFQEVATVLEFSWTVYSDRVLKWDMEEYMAHKAVKAKFDTHELLEAELKRQTAKLAGHVRTLSPEDLELPVAMPWPGETTVADSIHYHVWNMAYHEGQIAALLMQMGIDPMPG